MTIEQLELVKPSRRAPLRDRPRYVEIGIAHAAALAAHFLSLSPNQRRARFGCAMSDYAIRRHCADRDWGFYHGIARTECGKLTAVAELFGAPDWQNPELALSIDRAEDEGRVRAELLQLALFAARKRRAECVLIQFVARETWVPTLANEFDGTVDVTNGTAIIPVDEFEDTVAAQ